MFPDYNDDVRSLRGQPRRKIFQPVDMQAAGQAVRAHLLDLSASGALVHSTTPPAPGTPLRLTIGGAVRTARVVWRDGVRFGIAFALPLDAADVARVLGG
jgi:hypothetical protein